MVGVPISFNHEAHIYDEDKVVWEMHNGFQEAFRRDLPAGAAEWSIDFKALDFVCPCGCGSVGSLTVTNGFKHSWLWDGDRERPTITPSIELINGCRWHGYLKAGVWESCS